MPDSDFQRLMERLEGSPDPTPDRQTRVLAGVVIGVGLLLVMIPVAMKLLFDPATGLADIALGGSPLSSLWGPR